MLRKKLFLLIIGFFMTTNANVNAETANGKTETIVLAGGCFWGVQAVFQHTKGVVSAISGYAGGKADTAHYDTVSTGTTNHAESVQVIYNPREISLDKLLDVYFKVAHNPTELNYQGVDSGTQYRSAIFYNSPEQQKIASEKIAKLMQDKQFSDPIVAPLSAIYCNARCTKTGGFAKNLP